MRSVGAGPSVSGVAARRPATGLEAWQPAKGILCVDLSPYVDPDGWQTIDACWHVPSAADVALAAEPMVSIELGLARRLDNRVLEALVEQFSGRSVEVRGSVAEAVRIVVDALNTSGRAASHDHG